MTLLKLRVVILCDTPACQESHAKDFTDAWFRAKKDAQAQTFKESGFSRMRPSPAGAIGIYCPGCAGRIAAKKKGGAS